ncbi:MAG: PIN domain-containing protein, partial [Acidobacteriota bacterium]
FETDTLVTTDYVIDETLTLLRARGYDHRAQMLGEAFFGNSLADVHYLDERQIRAAWDVFRLYQDKKWSFTDCSSRVVMETLNITKAISLDRHFHQFGTIEVFPMP